MNGNQRFLDGGIIMEIKEILSKVDHTLLKPESTWEQIKEICDDGIKYETASVCIPPSFVKQAADYVDGKIAICTVIGFLMDIILQKSNVQKQHRQLKKAQRKSIWLLILDGLKKEDGMTFSAKSTR